MGVLPKQGWGDRSANQANLKTMGSKHQLAHKLIARSLFHPQRSPVKIVDVADIKDGVVVVDHVSALFLADPCSVGDAKNVALSLYEQYVKLIRFTEKLIIWCDWKKAHKPTAHMPPIIAYIRDKWYDVLDELFRCFEVNIGAKVDKSEDKNPTFVCFIQGGEPDKPCAMLHCTDAKDPVAETVTSALLHPGDSRMMLHLAEHLSQKNLKSIVCSVDCDIVRLYLSLHNKNIYIRWLTNTFKETKNMWRPIIRLPGSTTIF